jgi:hypothetical protein
VKAETHFDCVWGHTERPGMWEWSGTQAIEAKAPVTAWPRLRIASKDELLSEAGPIILET